MQYLEYTFTMTPSCSDFQDVLEAVLAEAGFDSFIKDEQGEAPLKAYVRKDFFDAAALEEGLANFPLPVKIDYTAAEAENKNWNEEWERHSFAPLVIDQKCVVCAPYHDEVPEAKYKIVIMPRMSFGTGHHETTGMMLKALLDMELSGKMLLDMGCGTGLLAILAKLRGAAKVTAIDNDEWCVQNTEENMLLNGINDFDVRLGDARLLPEVGPFDVILANIHLNIILNDLSAYVQRLNKGGYLLVSGFYETDVPTLETAALELGLEKVEVMTENDWCRVTFRKM